MTRGIPEKMSASTVDQQSVDIPEYYSHFRDVFCPKATQLPPHRPWDCAIDLLPDESVPKGKIYPLSLPEQKAMEEYIEEALQQGYIRPSTSPAVSSFFFCGQEGWRLAAAPKFIGPFTVTKILSPVAVRHQT